MFKIVDDVGINFFLKKADYAELHKCLFGQMRKEQEKYSIPSSTDIGKGKLTVGKIYGGLLILENWKQTKFGSFPTSKVGT